MKKLGIVIICLFLLFAIVVMWFGDDAPFKPIYWLVGKLVASLFLIIGLVLTKYNSKEDTIRSSLFNIIFTFLLVGYFLIYKAIVEYNRNTCQDRFGLAFNKTRRIFGTPEIPGNWHIRFRMDRSVDWWKGENDTIGHVSKDISMDSVCKIKLEEDEYNLKPIKGVSRNLSITTYYTNDKEDSIVYYYEPGNNNHKISRQQADSIFAVEKISKDY